MHACPPHGVDWLLLEHPHRANWWSNGTSYKHERFASGSFHIIEHVRVAAGKGNPIRTAQARKFDVFEKRKNFFNDMRSKPEYVDKTAVRYHVQ